MSGTPQPPPGGTQRKSRVLAALDNPSFFSPNPIAQPPTASPALPLPPASSGIPYTPVKQRYKTPAPSFNYATVMGLAGLASIGSSHKKRKVSGPENEYGYGHAGGSSPMPLPATPRLGSSLHPEFGLNYDNEAPVRSIDRGGEDQAAKLAEFVSRGIENAAHGLTSDKAVEKLGLSDAKDLIPGMEVRLLPHQIIGVSWMVDQELKTEYKGGILADDMGLGKTVQMIANMVMNQPKPNDEHRATLVVVPAALLLQWKEELETKTNGMWEVHIQHGKDKIKNVEKLNEKDVIITTYHTLNLDFNIPHDVDSCEELDWLKENGGPMSQTKWFRVILDEAQFVRNRSTRCSKAVAMLRSKYRWCLTGTPITNTLADLYGFLRFGKFRPFNDWEDFNDHVAKVQLEDAQLAGDRARALLKPILLRRTKDAKLENGEPILQLPPKHVDLVYVEFSKDERELYMQFEKRAQIQINRFIRNNTLLKNHQQVLVLILRLRQVCTHPYLVLSETDGFADPTLLLTATADDKEAVRATKLMGANWVARIKQKFLDSAKAIELVLDDDDAGDEQAVCPKCGDLLLEDNGRILSCGDEICSDCLDVLAHEQIDHNGIFGNHDEQTNLRIEKEFETAAAKGLRPCPKCKKMQDLRPNSVFKMSAFMPSHDEVRAACRAATKARERARSPPAKKAKIEISFSDDDSSDDSGSDDGMPDLAALLKSSPRDDKKGAKGKGKKGKDSDVDTSSASDSDSDFPVKKKGQGKSKGNGKASSKGNGRGKANTRPPPKKDEDRDESEPPAPADPRQFDMWKQGGSNVESSAKMLQMIGYLKEWESSGDKTIVFSQWTSMLDLCEQVFARHGIRSLRYDGQMNREAREYCLMEFRRLTGPKVVLVSIKCGGVGLNLVSANRVINLDLSWNYATESQAYDRVHRLGQEKEVFVKRLVIRDTIEERMLKLQDTKLGLSDAALGEGTLGKKLERLSVKQIRDLFGMNRNQQQDPNQTRLQP
ncbi:SNF2 family N-terminal domain-containing protein [Daedaleopsis nitida]|nr:SNF2 family N-terminal domain-containing protein [Daedaleopsis nitida]